MTYLEIKELCKKGKIGMIPYWKGYLKYNYAKDELLFINGDYILSETELENLVKNRNDLYYII